MIYAALDASGQPQQLDPGRAFTTYRFRVSNQTEAQLYSAEVGVVIDLEVSHPPGVLAGWGDAERLRYQVTAMDLPTPPAGKVLLSWSLAVAEGTITVVPAFGDQPPTPVPAIVSRMQAWQALNAAGQWTEVNDAINASPDKTVWIYWNTASDFHRDHPSIAAMATALGMSDAQVDDLFRAAALIS